MDVRFAYTGPNMGIAQQLVAGRTQMEDLANQLTTGLKSQTFEGVSNLALTLSFQTKISENAAYQDTITNLSTRANLLTNSLESMRTLSSNTAGGLDPNAFVLTSNGKTSAQTTALNTLDSYVNTLDVEYSGIYSFGGKATDSPPVVTTDVMINGEGAKAGYKTVAAQRLQADTGANGLGRLDLTTTGTTISLAEDGAHPFGMKLASVASTLTNATITDATAAAGGAAPHSLSIQVNDQPKAGDTLKLALTQPDGTTTTLTLTAGTANAADGTTFAIGATAADTQANLQAALQTALKGTAATETKAASAVAAANNFFDTQNGAMPQRLAAPVDGLGNPILDGAGNPDYTKATSLVAGTAANTVIWYTGTNDATNPRSDMTAKIDSGVSVSMGIRANEKGITDQIKSLAMIAALDVSGGTSTDQKAYSAAVVKAKPVLTTGATTNSIQSIEAEVAGAQQAGKLASDRLKLASSTYQQAVSNAMNADTTQVTVELTTLQTQLQASYKAASILYKLTLTDYM